MDVETAIRGRRTIAKFGASPVPRETIAELLDLAVWAPNHHRTEPWRFHVLAGEAREDLVVAVERWLQLNRDPEEAASRASAARSKLLRAPALIVVSQRRAAEPIADLEDYAACCCAIQNLLLAAHARGLAAKWSTGKIAQYAGVNEHLGIDPHDRIVAFVYLGLAEESPSSEAPSRSAAPVKWRGF